MLRKEINSLWKAGLAKKDKILFLFIMPAAVTFVMTGCSAELPEILEYREIVMDHEEHLLSEDDFDDVERIAAVYHEIYEEAVETNTLGSLEMMRRIVVRLGENGYVAVDSENQVDMAGRKKWWSFVKR